MLLVFRQPDMPPALNGKGGLLRIHWSKRKTLKQKFMWLIKEQRTEKLDGTVGVLITNYYSNVGMDWDNLASRFKIVGDALVALKLIKDDAPSVITSFKMAQKKVKTRKEDRLEINLYPVYPL